MLARELVMAVFLMDGLCKKNPLLITNDGGNRFVVVFCHSLKHTYPLFPFPARIPARSCGTIS